METAILLAVAASLCTATSSVCQRMGAKSSQTSGFDAGLVFRLARRPVWLLGIASLIGGFVLQLTALHFGPLALVQPILAAELVFVFGYLVVAGSGRVKRRDWLAAAAMSAGIGAFLKVASPSGGRLHAPGSSWLVAGLATAGVVFLAVAVAFGLGRCRGASGTRRAAVLGAATGISWGFMAAVIKELSSHLDDGAGAILSSWSLYLLIAAGAATMLLASHALAAGPLAASQPGFTILDPLSASLLGMFLFGEHIRTGAADLAGETLALAAVIVAAAVLAHSCHLAGENSHPVMVEFEEGGRLADIPAEPGMGTCGGGNSSRPERPARKLTFTYDWTQLTDEKHLPQDAWPRLQESAAAIVITQPEQRPGRATSDGFIYPRVLRWRLLRLRAILASSSAARTDRSVLVGSGRCFQPVPGAAFRPAGAQAAGQLAT